MVLGTSQAVQEIYVGVIELQFHWQFLGILQLIALIDSAECNRDIINTVGGCGLGGVCAIL